MADNETETTNEIYQVVYLGRMRDFGLGNPDGIPTWLGEATDEQLSAYGETLLDNLVEVTDKTALACVDGRLTLSNADGSRPMVRLRRVGGSASNFGVARNGDAPVVTTLNVDAPINDQAKAVDEIITLASGYTRSAHEGGCGGAGGEVSDSEQIATNPALLGATEAFMTVPAVSAYTGTVFSVDHSNAIRANAARTAELEKRLQWDGQSYVDSVIADTPSAVETLEVDDADEKFHGHSEPATAIIIGNKTLNKSADGPNPFVYNVKASIDVARALMSARGEAGYNQILTADIVKHFAVLDRLARPESPLFLLVAE